MRNGKSIKKSKLTAHNADGVPDPTMNNWKRVTSKFGDGDLKKDIPEFLKKMKFNFKGI